MEREPLCGVSYCPAPTDPDAHVCPHCGSNVIEHQHVIPRGMGGSPSRRDDPRNVVMICPDVHRDITLSKLSDGFIDLPRKRIYRIWDMHNNTVTECEPYWIQPEKENDDAGMASQDGGVLADVGGVDGDEHRDLATVGLAGNDEGGGSVHGDSGGALVHGASQGSGPPSGATSFTQWAEQGKRLAQIIADVPWHVGDWVCEGEDRFGEQASQYIDQDLGIDSRVLNQYARVAKRFPQPWREEFPLPWTYFRNAAAIQNDSEAREALSVALSERLTTSAHARLLSGKSEAEPVYCTSCGQRVRETA